MSWESDEQFADDEPLARPFLSRPDVPAVHPRAPGDAVARWVDPVTGRPRSAQDPAAPAVYQHPGTSQGRGQPGGAAGYPDLPDHPSGHHGEVRPYLLTGGRTQSRGTAVAMETVVLATGTRPVRATDAAGQERIRIVQLAERPCSAAEVAAWLHLPLQVALVLVSDLVAEGLLDASRVATSQSDDVLFLERLIAGVAAL